MTSVAGGQSDAGEIRISPLAVFCLWTVYSLLLYTQVRLNAGPNVRAPWKPWGPFVFWMSSAWVWAALTLPIAVLTALRASIRIFPLASGEVNNVGPFIIRPEHAQ